MPLGLTVVRCRVLAVAAMAGPLLLSGGILAPQAHAKSIRQYEWHLDGMHADEMWKVSTGKGVTVAVVDTGVEDSYSELRGQVLPGKDFFSGGGKVTGDNDGHGTRMATLIAGTGGNGQGVYGLAPGSKILPLRIGDHDNELNPDFLSNISDAIRYAADSEAKVISISAAMPEDGVDKETRDSLQGSVDYAISKGKLIFAGTGNDGDKSNLPELPSAIPGVVGVGAVDKTATAIKSSTFGPQVALAAPGDDLITICGDERGGYCKSDGTSGATALASASAALIWSKHPSWTGNQILRVMMNTAGKPKSGKIPSDYIGYGVVRPRIALLEGTGDPGPADINPLTKKSYSSQSPSTTSGKQSASPTPSKSSSAQAAASDESDSNTGLWIALGVGAAVLIAAAVIIILIRRNRNNTQPPSGPAVPSAPPYQASWPPSGGTYGQYGPPAQPQNPPRL